MHNLAVRSSSADFAALCYDTIMMARSQSRDSQLDVAMIDYSLTSTPDQLEALLNKFV